MEDVNYTLIFNSLLFKLKQIFLQNIVILPYKRNLEDLYNSNVNLKKTVH